MAFEQDASDVLAQFDHLEMLGNFVDEDVGQQKLVHLSNVIRNRVAAERERCAKVSERFSGVDIGVKIAAAIRKGE